MYGANVKYFHCICGPLHKLIGKCFKCCIDKDDNEYGGDVVAVYEIEHSRPSSMGGTSTATSTMGNMEVQIENNQTK